MPTDRVTDCPHRSVEFIGYQHTYGTAAQERWPMFKCRLCGTSMGPDRARGAVVHVPGDAVPPGGRPAGARSVVLWLALASELLVLASLVWILVGIGTRF